MNGKMLKISALKISITTSKGMYGTPIIKFSNGLNIIKGFNSTGKSTIFQSILYCLGMEELLGGKNDKTMQSVLKSEILNKDGKLDASVIESNVLLEIEGDGNRFCTIKRYISSQTKSSTLLEVFNGKAITEPGEYNVQPMYVHDAGAADNENAFGFHSFLEKFIGWDLPFVQYKDGNQRKLYMQNLFPGFVIEQKIGWGDFLATIPYYSLLDKETRAIEFILNLDSFIIQQQKAEIRQSKFDINTEWKEKFGDLKRLAQIIGFEVRGIIDQPEVLDSRNVVNLSYVTNEDNYTYGQYIRLLEEQYEDLVKDEIPNVGAQAEQSEKRISGLNENLSRYSITLSATINKKNLAIDKHRTFADRLTELENDKTQNEYHLKVKKKGAEDGFAIAHDHCPFCSQDLSDSLLPRDIDIVPMQIEDNIEYLKSQIKLIKIYISSNRNEISGLESDIEKLNDRISETRAKIRTLKTQLTSDNRLPSIELIEKRLRLKAKLDLFRNKFDEFVGLQEDFKLLSDEWVEVLSREKNIPKSLSTHDYKKIAELETVFKNLLRSFHYRSKPIADITISRETLLPVVERYSLRFDSSAKDFTRAMWSYTLALRETALKFGGNHPGLLILDEPGQHDAGDNDLRFLLSRLSTYTTQSLVFASFHQSEEAFQECTNGISFSLVDLGEDKYIKKLRS